MSKTKSNIKLKMVAWYDPAQLFRTAQKTAISTIIGEYADPRAGAADPTPGKFFDYSNEIKRTQNDFEAIEGKERNEIWIDYASDVGDGWNSTYAVAYNLAKLKLAAKSDQLEKETIRGEILVLGGDGVYPTASAEEYERRLVTPYRMAFKASQTNVANPPPDIVNLKEEPHIFVLPGNHDWYDSLVAFKKLFCSHIFNDRKFASAEETNQKGQKNRQGGWRTRQKRSYFALKLPHRWWLLGIDLQLSHNIDLTQLDYFESIIKHMKTGDKVILCVPEPYWVKAIKYQDITDRFEQKEESIEKLEKFFDGNGIDLKVYIAGDLHHYRRFEADDGSDVHKITAGGGGAFLHPTHDFKYNAKKAELINEAGSLDEKVEKRLLFSLKKSYPSFSESRKQDWKNLWFFWNNPKFGIVTAVIYTILAWFVYAGIDGRPDWVKDVELALHNLFNNPPGILSALENVLFTFFGNAVGMTSARLIREPIAAIIVILMVFGLIFFTDSNSKPYKWVAGLVHAGSHLFAAFLLGWVSYLAGVLLIEKFALQHSWWVWCLVLAVFLIASWLVGALIMGVYLFVSLHIFGRHDNEAFSGLRIEDYKNFLRLHVDTDGSLTIFPFKIEKVPRGWNPVLRDKETDYYTPGDGDTPSLIEKPVQIKNV